MSLPEGWRHAHLARVGSTNDELLDRAASGEKAGLWLTADEQTDGRGRRGRAWHSPPGNLYASVLLHAPGPPEAWPTLSFVCAIALHDALVGLYPVLRADARLKWPNDLLIDGAKAAGLLVEARGNHVVCGFGVNVALKPSSGLYPTTCLLDHASGASTNSVLSALATAFADHLNDWNGGHGFAVIRQRWLAAAIGLGEPIVVRLPDRELHGTFEALDERGQLILRDAKGVAIPVAAGDIFLTRSLEAT